MDEYTRRQIAKRYKLYSEAKDHFLKEEKYTDVNKAHEFGLMVLELENKKAD